MSTLTVQNLTSDKASLRGLCVGIAALCTPLALAGLEVVAGMMIIDDEVKAQKCKESTAASRLFLLWHLINSPTANGATERAAVAEPTILAITTETHSGEPQHHQAQVSLAVT